MGDPLLDFLRSYAPRRRARPAVGSFPSSRRALHAIVPRLTSAEPLRNRTRGLDIHTRRYVRAREPARDLTEPPKEVAVLGGGITGLTAAFYLAQELPETSTITVYEAASRLGGWIRTEKVPVNVAGVRGEVTFERGPRTLRSLKNTLWRCDDLVLYDLVGLPLPRGVVIPRF